MLKTRVCELLNIRYPLLQGGMAWVSTAELAAAVSNGGGLGIIAAGNAPADWVKSEIEKAKTLTNSPFGVNVMLLSPYADEVIEVVLAAKVGVITTGAGNPGKYLSSLKKAGIKVIPVVNSVSLAKRLEKAGVDAVIGEGMEAGGHVGTETSMVLIPQLAEAVSIPVIAAGGIADGRGVAATLMLGAEGVQLGTRFICAQECTVHPEYKRRIVKARDRDTVVTGLRTGHPVRIIKNRLAKRFKELDEAGASLEELENLGAGRLRIAAQEGVVDEGSVMAGQSCAMVKEVKPAGEIVEEIMTQAEKVLEKAHN